eukprot:gene34976-43131_t
MFEPPNGMIKAITEALHASGVLTASCHRHHRGGYLQFRTSRGGHHLCVRRKMDDKLFTLQEQHEQRLYDVDYGPGTEDERRLMAAAVYRDWTDKRYLIEGSADVIRSQMISQIEQYTRPKSATRIRPRSATSSVDLNALISGVKWDPSVMSALEFIEKIEVLLAMYESQGNTMRPQTHDAMIFGAFGRAENPEFKEDIGEAQKKGKTLQWLVDRLSRTGAQESMKKLLKEVQFLEMT